MNQSGSNPDETNLRRRSAGCRDASTQMKTSARIVHVELADALAKGVFILGPDRGMALIEKLPQVEGVIVSAKNEVSISSGLRGRLMVLAPPTDAP